MSRFDETGSVDPTDRKGVPSKLSDYYENIIIDNLLEKPGMYLHELQYEISNITGTQVDESTIYRFLKRNNFMHKRFKLFGTTVQCHFKRAIAIYLMCLFMILKSLLFLDEMGSDRKSAQRMFGYSPIGTRAYSCPLLLKGKRFSAISMMSINGMLDVYVTPNNVNAEIFEDFIDKSLLKHMPFMAAIQTMF